MMTDKDARIQWNGGKLPEWLKDHSKPIPRGKVRRGKYRRVAAVTHGELARCPNCGGIVSKEEDVICPNCKEELK
jgi:rubrerythrin